MTSQQQPMKFKTQQIFSGLWPQAQQQGWHLVTNRPNSQGQIVFPPPNHPAALEHWTGIYNNVNYDNRVVSVPHWFYSEVSNSNNPIQKFKTNR